MTIGVVGGMGVQATARFYNQLIALQTVKREQDYIDVLIYSKSSIPDRTAYILRHSDESPLPTLNDAIQVLRNAGCGCIAIPCVTSHYFWDALHFDANTPILHMPDITAQAIQNRELTRVGLLATSGTVQGRFFHDALARRQIEIILPDEKSQARLMDYIYAIKANNPIDAHCLHEISAQLRAHGAQAVILGCTELNMDGNTYNDAGILYIDALKLLARAALEYCKTN
ncbi:MAG: amino acid racemase [Defluviitaleaceae bacterium]|nr:amino acid racemase [Defluviitaleaceae bacterium]